MKLLVVGNGAREHAIAWKLKQSPHVSKLYVAPGNAGTAELAHNVPISATDITGLLRYAQEQRIDFTVVGPETPLAAGIVNLFQDAGLLIFGPTREAALIESSKVFSKELMLSCGVPTGAAKWFSDYAEARRWVEESPLPVVVKADGLAAGKGVVVAQTRQEALEALRQQMEQKVFGAAGERVLIEECLQGQEISVFAFVDGEVVSPMVAACDYKRAGDGDTGPNTGGMGSFSPPTVWTARLEAQVRREIMEPVARAMCARGRRYQGALYAGLMLTEEGPRVIEFNCRLGDPETQVILPRLKSDLAEVMIRTAEGKLDGLAIEWDPDSIGVGVVMASGGYPGRYATGYPIEGLDAVDEDAIVFHAGTKIDLTPVPSPFTERGGNKPTRAANGMGVKCVTDGGRVLTVTALGSTLAEARRKAYANIERISFKDGFYRRDIAGGG